MRFFCALLFLAVSAGLLGAEDFAAELAKTVQNLEKNKAAVAAGSDGWLFFGGELRLLSLGRFWGSDATKVSRAHKADLADPLPAILDFEQQLKTRGIELLMVPVPPKASIYPEKIVTGVDLRTTDPAPELHRFYEELRAAGIDVLDLSAVFVRNRENSRGPVFCKTDSHWSGIGCALAAEAIAEKVRATFTNNALSNEYAADWKDAQISGDLDGLLAKDGHKPGPEKIAIQSVSRKSNGAAVEPDANSPLLLLGD